MPRRPDNWNDRLSKAIMNQPRFIKAEEAKERLKRIKNAIAARKRKKQILFDIWSFADRFLEALECIRDMNVPKNPNDDFNDDFISAVELIPYVRERARNLWGDYVFYNDYSDVLKLVESAETDSELMKTVDAIMNEDTTDAIKLEKLNGLLTVTTGENKYELDLNELVSS